uniref:DJ-1/PfpI domain-containing protein n=1 Tax=Panagrolaimus superbus TaxID=310955 RepID=A0A914YSH4_9BILA
MAPKVLIVAFKDVEDIELTVTVDVLRRADIDVTIANLNDEEYFVCSRKTTIKADALFRDIEDKDFDAVIVPGGPGSTKKETTDDERLGKILQRHEKAGKIVGAICAAPFIFTVHGIGKDGEITGYPSVKDKIIAAGYKFREDENVVVSKNVVTSRGPGTAFAFALKLVEILTDETKSKEVGNNLLYNQ